MMRTSSSSVCPALHYVACQCAFDDVWKNNSVQLTVYPRSKLIVWKGLLFRFLEPIRSVFGLHRLCQITLAEVVIFPRANNNEPPHMCLAVCGDRIGSTDWRLAVILYGVGLTRVRRLQRWFRRLKWQKRALAVMMSTHKRLGSDSPMALLDADILRLML
jgi:hypothetical protein